MTIAAHINTINLESDPPNSFNYQILSYLAARHPSHHFVFIFDAPYKPGIIREKNITPVLLGPSIRNNLLRHFWYNFKLPQLLVKYNVDVFFSDGVVTSLRSKTRQCFFLPDLSFLQERSLYNKADKRYVKSFIKKFVAKANCILVFNEQVGKKLAQLYPASRNKTELVPYNFGFSSTQLPDEQLQVAKDRWTEGKEYFISFVTAASQMNARAVLKAFSLFKKRQLSNMQLVMMANLETKEELEKDLSTYKYRGEVKLVVAENDEQLQSIIAASYAAFYLPVMEVLEDTGFRVLSNNIPLITTRSGFSISLYKEAALFTNEDEKSIAEQMMNVYKDENMRNGLIRNGRELIASSATAITASRLLEYLEKTAVQTS